MGATRTRTSSTVGAGAAADRALAGMPVGVPPPRPPGPAMVRCGTVAVPDGGPPPLAPARSAATLSLCVPGLSIPRAVIRIVLVDDHPTLRMGLEAALEDEPGLLCVGSVGSDHELWPVLAEQRPDVVVLDYHLPGSDGLHLCRRLKAADPALRVLILSAYASDDLAVAAVVAGADALLSKSAPGQQIRDAVRRAAGGEQPERALRPDVLQRAALRVEPEDLPLLGMLLDGTSARDIEAVLA